MTSRSSRNVLTVVLSLLTLAASPAVAAAEVERPVQGESSNGLFLSYAPEPSEDGALCLVDSGVDENHDTEEGIIERTSVAGDGSSGEDVDTDERHGTSMAMVAGAPRNGWGMVGAWSQLKVVGVRAVQRGEDGFRFDAYRNAIQRCRQLKTEEGLPIKVVLLALGGSDSPSDSDLERLEDSVKQARDRGINVVAAAGNDGADEVVYPARLDEVLAVGAAEHDGGLCSFSNHGEGLDLTAPGCELDTADPRSGDETEGNGTSHAAAIVAATIAALRTYDEDIDVDEAEGLILDTTDDDTLDVEASFQRAGLDEVVEAGRNNIPDRDEGSEDAGARRGGRDAGGGSSGGSGSGGSDTRGEPGDTVPLAPLPPTLAALPAPSFTHVVRRGVLRLRLPPRPAFHALAGDPTGRPNALARSATTMPPCAPARSWSPARRASSALT